MVDNPIQHLNNWGLVFNPHALKTVHVAVQSLPYSSEYRVQIFFHIQQHLSVTFQLLIQI